MKTLITASFAFLLLLLFAMCRAAAQRDRYCLSCGAVQVQREHLELSTKERRVWMESECPNVDCVSKLSAIERELQAIWVDRGNFSL